MFTGLIEAVGTIELEHQKMIVQLPSSFHVGELRLGESVAIDGVCLTVIETDPALNRCAFEVSSETRSLTRFGQSHFVKAVNVERSLKIGDRLGGHFVLGHVDGIGTITHSELERPNPNGNLLSVQLPRNLIGYCVSKGSIAIQGVSLTINQVDRERSEISVMIIPHTAMHTNLASCKVGTMVNIEIDYLAKLVKESSHYGKSN